MYYYTIDYDLRGGTSLKDCFENAAWLKNKFPMPQTFNSLESLKAFTLSVPADNRYQFLVTCWIKAKCGNDDISHQGNLDEVLDW